MPILAHGNLLVILFWSLCEDSLLFYKSWHGDRYNCSNTCLYALWSTLIVILRHSISFFSRYVFDEFIAKGESMGTKWVELFANRVDERKNMTNDYLRGRACIESVRQSRFQGECRFWPFVLVRAFLTLLSFSFLCHFAWLCRFSCRLLTFTVFLFLDDLLELFLAFLVF
jgi:hypothetical protein